MADRIIAPEQFGDDQDQDLSLRPATLSDFVGQEKLKESLSVFLQAARDRKEPIDHILFAGPPGLGKTTLAHIIAREMGANLKITSGPALDKPSELAGLLTNLETNDVLFIDEIHRLSRVIEEFLYPAMEDFKIDIMLESGPSAKCINLPLKRFTLVGATTRTGMLTSPLRDRFGITFRLETYSDAEMKKILLRSARILKVDLTPEGTELLAARCRGTPRVGNRVLRRCRDVAQVKGTTVVGDVIVTKTLDMLGIDPRGLDEMDRNILKTIINKFEGGPVGLSTLGASLGEETETLEEVYEPYLIQLGFLKRTPRGRMATANAFRHLGLIPPSPAAAQEELL
ncbi:MAG: Holliday junction helicase RuvB [Fibrobacteres bacterium]|nr:Holliday junction helicase RuvB [Fibrobacterota bacterium]